MAQRATKETYAFEPVGPDAEVRRLVHAGDRVPGHWRLESKGDFEDSDGTPSGGLPQAYKHQLDDDGHVEEEHAPEEGTGPTRPPRRRAAKKE